MSPFTPHIFVSLLALGMGLAFVSADRNSSSSRALAASLGLIGISIYLNVTLIPANGPSPSWSGWLALPEGASIVATLEWLLRVRRTVPARGDMNVTFGDRLLRIGQAAGVVYAVLAVLAPEVRTREFLHALDRPQAMADWGFWLFATPIFVAQFTGFAAILLLLNRRPDRPEVVRVVAMTLAVPFLVAGFVLPLAQSALSVLIGELIFLVGGVHYHVLQGNRGQFMSRFLSPQVAQIVRERGLQSAMKQDYLEVTVVCTDIRGFTPYAQAHEPARVIQVLRDYYDAVGKVVAEYGGTIKDFAGDGILILVGAPIPVNDHARCGIEMARRARQQAQEVTRRWSEKEHRLGIGLGVASGFVAVGVIGSASRLEYTAVGPAVNLASRLCELAADGEILIAERTAEIAGASGLKPRSQITVKGFKEPVPIFAAP